MIAKEINVRRITKDSKTIQPEPGGSIILLWLPEWSVVQLLTVAALARSQTLPVVSCGLARGSSAPPLPAESLQPLPRKVGLLQGRKEEEKEIL